MIPSSIPAFVAKNAHNLKFLVRNNSTTILTGVGIAGTVTTAVLTGRASMAAARKIDREQQDRYLLNTEPGEKVDPIISNKEKAKMVWREYIPAAGVGVITVSSIILAQRINAKRIATLLVASSLSERALQEYKDKVVERIGPTKADNIQDEIAQDRVTNSEHKSGDILVVDEAKSLCYDEHVGRYFTASMEDLKRAENEANFAVLNNDFVTLAEFHEWLDLEPTSYSQSVGWNRDQTPKLRITSTIAKGRPCLAFDYVKPPFPGYDVMGHG